MCGATVEQRDGDEHAVLVCAQCSTARPLVCLHCHGSTFRAVRPGVTRVRDDLAALLPRTEVASVDAATADVPDVPVLIGTEAVLHRVAHRAGAPVGLVAYLELDQELLAPRARAAEQALWLLVRGARLLARILEWAGSAAASRPGCRTTRCSRRSDGASRCWSSRPRRLGARRSASRRSVGWPSCSGAAEAVAAACEALAEAGVTARRV